MDPRIRCNRACVARDLVLLASSADQQLEYFARTGTPREELILEWLDWDCMVLPEVIEAGALTEELVAITESITAEVTALNEWMGQEFRRDGTSEAHRRLHSDEALRNWDEWEHIRAHCRRALALLSEMGVTARLLNDPNYHDAPVDCDDWRAESASAEGTQGD